MRHAERLTRTPSEVTLGDVEVLRHAGFSDRAVLDLTLVIAYFNFVTRLADGLGVPLE